MAGARISWTRVDTSFPEGTSPADHYVAHLGALVSPNLPLTATSYVFATVDPGDYPTSVETVAVSGAILATKTGPVLHVPTPVVAAIADNIAVALVA